MPPVKPDAEAPALEKPTSEPAKRRAWRDDDDETGTAVPAFVRAAAVDAAPLRPKWAAAAAGRRHARDESKQEEETAAEYLARAVLTSGDPVLEARADALDAVHPRPASTIMIPKEPIKDMAWHPSGQMLAVTTTRAVHLYHVAGSFVERVSTTAIKGKGLAQSAMVQSGDHVVVLPSGGYVPLKVTLATGEVSALNFLDSRLSNSSVRAQAGTSTDTCPTLFTPCPGDKSGLRFAMPVGSRIVLGSLASSSVMQTLTLPGHVNDVVFVSEYEIAAAVGPSVLFYDTRRVGKCVRRIQDEGALECTRLCSFGGSSLVVGSSSGAVNLYQLAGVASTVAPRPAKTFLNLSTSCDLLVAGPMSAPLAASTAAAGAGAGLGAGFLMGSSQQQAGFRLVSLPEGRVTPRFPAASMNHNFVQCVAYHPTAPIFSIGEYGRIVNYAC